MPALGKILGRSLGLGGVFGAWLGAHKFTDYQSKKLEAYYGSDIYSPRYAKGMETTKTAINILGIYGGVSALWKGRPITFGAMSLAKWGKRSARGFAGRFGNVVKARGQYRGASAAARRIRRAGPADEILGPMSRPVSPSGRPGYARPAFSMRESEGRLLRIAEFEKLRRKNIYREAKKDLLRPGRHRPRRKTPWRVLNPANWSHKALIASGIGSFAGGAALGSVAMPRMTRYPILESGNVQSYKPVFQRLNYSTTGLTQALHNRRNRTFTP